MTLRCFLLSLMLACTPTALARPAQAPIPVADFVRHPTYSTVKISPDGTYLAMTVDRGDQDVLTVLRTADLSLVRVNQLPDGKSVGQFEWAAPDRLVFNAIRKIGSYTQPFATGEWFAVNADGTMPRTLVAYGTRDATQRGKAVGNAVFSLLDTLTDDDRNVVMQVNTPRSSEGAGTEVVLLDVYSGRRQSLARAPRENCTIALDAAHRPRFANCGTSKAEDGGFETRSLLFRLDDGRKWALVNDSRDSGRHLEVIGGDGGDDAYARASDGKAPAAFGRVDGSGKRFSELFRDEVADVSSLVRSADERTVIAVATEAGVPRVEIIEPAHPDADVYLEMSRAFPGQNIAFTSATRDGSRIVVGVSGARNPGELYLYDRASGQARFLMRNVDWIDRSRLAQVRPFSFTASDGTRLHGYLTVPGDGTGKRLPMVVNPHGGPIGPRDRWSYDWSTQLLASRGYLVLQVNFRGSGGYGQAFQDAGHGAWGTRIQDDINDAARWAVAQGFADPDRICIFGGSFGGYSALMAPIRSPGLYKCAIGYVGVYDMALMYEKGDVEDSSGGLRFLRHTIGSGRASLDAISPARQADRIGIPVLLAAGARDFRAAPEHTEAMRDALVKAGNPPDETIIQSGEMHGFYDPAHREALYTKILSFLQRNIGGNVDVGDPAQVR